MNLIVNHALKTFAVTSLLLLSALGAFLMHAPQDSGPELTSDAPLSATSRDDSTGSADGTTPEDAGAGLDDDEDDATHAETAGETPPDEPAGADAATGDDSSVPTPEANAAAGAGVPFRAPTRPQQAASAQDDETASAEARAEAHATTEDAPEEGGQEEKQRQPEPSDESAGPAAPEAPEAPDGPKTPSAPEVPTTPAAPQAPSPPKAPQQPETPQQPEAPTAPEPPAVPDEAGAVSPPAVPENGSRQEQAGARVDSEPQRTPATAPRDVTTPPLTVPATCDHEACWSPQRIESRNASTPGADPMEQRLPYVRLDPVCADPVLCVGAIEVFRNASLTTPGVDRHNASTPAAELAAPCESLHHACQPEQEIGSRHLATLPGLESLETPGASAQANATLAWSYDLHRDDDEVLGPYNRTIEQEPYLRVPVSVCPNGCHTLGAPEAQASAEANGSAGAG